MNSLTKKLIGATKTKREIKTCATQKQTNKRALRSRPIQRKLGFAEPADMPGMPLSLAEKRITTVCIQIPKFPAKRELTTRFGNGIRPAKAGR